MIEVVAMDEWRIVVPMRLRRFNYGHLPTIDCPDVDDRGYKMGTRPSPWGATTVRGPSLGVVHGDTVKVGVVREDIDDSAPLFATSTATGTLEVATPNGGPIGPDGEVQLRGVASGTATVQLRLGGQSGPILFEADVRVHDLLRVALTPHLVRIDSSSTVGAVPAMDINAMVRRLRAIWRPCGIDFRVAATVNDHITLPSNQVNKFDLTTGTWKQELAAMLGLQRTRLALAAGTNDESINWYIIQEFVPLSATNTFVGYGESRESAQADGITDTGIVVAAMQFGNPRDPEFTARTLAHEIGHFFRLAHVQRRNLGNPVTDTYGRKQLMYPLSSLNGGTNGEAVPRFNDIGYGDHVRGCLLTMKNHAHHSTDGECATARNAIHSNNWF
jgi:hypothetical protein